MSAPDASRARAQAAADHRAAYPKLADLVDDFRKSHPGARLLAGIEDGREVGRVDDDLRELRAMAQLPPATETEQERLLRVYAAERAAAGVRP